MPNPEKDYKEARIVIEPMVIEYLRKNHYYGKITQTVGFAGDDHGIDFIANNKNYDIKQAYIRTINDITIGKKTKCICVAIERWSNREQKIAGWAFDKTKQTDYIVFALLNKDKTAVKRVWRVNFKSLVALCEWSYDQWNERFIESEQTNEPTYSPSYTSEHIFIPINYFTIC